MRMTLQLKARPVSADHLCERGDMSFFQTKHFGRIPLEPEVEFHFARGLPGFDSRRRFVPLHFPQTDPLIFLQSLEDADLCFITVPVLVVDPEYRLSIERDDLEFLEL